MTVRYFCNICGKELTPFHYGRVTFENIGTYFLAEHSNERLELCDECYRDVRSMIRERPTKNLSDSRISDDTYTCYSCEEFCMKNAEEILGMGLDPETDADDERRIYCPCYGGMACFEKDEEYDEKEEKK